MDLPPLWFMAAKLLSLPYPVENRFAAARATGAAPGKARKGLKLSLFDHLRVSGCHLLGFVGQEFNS